MNQRGSGIVEIAAWIIVVCFVAKLATLAVIGVSVLDGRASKLNLQEYNSIHLALAR